MEQRIKLTFEHPRSWWRRLLRLPAKRTERGPYNVRPWSDIFETDQGTVAQAGFTMNVSMDNSTARFTPNVRADGL